MPRTTADQREGLRVHTQASGCCVLWPDVLDVLADLADAERELAESRAEVEALREALRSVQLLARSEHQSGRNDIWLTVYDRAAAALATSTATAEAPEPDAPAEEERS